MKPEFVHLHAHSDYSLLDGACRIDELVKKVDSLGMRALALTDHGNLFGAITFYQKALESGIKPIIGVEAYVAPRSRFEKKEAKGIKEASHHLTLLCRNERGYRNLLKLITLANREGFYYKPRIDKELLDRYKDGLMALSGCPNSEFGHACRADQPDRALQVADEYRQILGAENFYLEIQNHGMQEEKGIIEGATAAAGKLGLKIVGTNDAHYLSKEDARAHDALLAINTGKRVTDTDRLRYPMPEFYIKSPEEMAVAFADFPEALRNSLEVAEKCNLELRFDEFHLPRFDLPQTFARAIDYLRSLCEEGMRWRYGDPPLSKVEERLAHELSVIEKMDFAGYFLFVWDIRRFAREHGVRMGPGRGSAAGSLVAYVLRITDIDPLRYELIFERFLNPSRRELPDIDLDFSDEDRPKVIEYIRTKYGKDNVAQIITFGTMKARLVLRDVGRVLGVDLKTVDQLAKRIPQGPDVTLKDAQRMDAELKAQVEHDPVLNDLWKLAERLEGLCRHASKHASGVAIADQPLMEYVPLYVADEAETTQYDMNVLAKLGLLKIDVLGLETLTVLWRAIQLVEKTRGIKIDLEKIPLDDSATYAMLTRGTVKGVFQLETSRGMRDLAQNMKPDRIEDLIATIALYRPGPLGSGMVDMYIRCKHGLEKPSYQHPLLEPILRETNGVILYQEQVMRIAHHMAGLPMSDCDMLRKAMGKKKPEIMTHYRDLFVKGAVTNGISGNLAGEIFDRMAYFGGYGFNKSHSAAYGIISYQTAYLKANYPVEYMTALLSCSMGNSDKVAEYLEECRRLGIEVLPPDVNASGHDFTIEGGKIRFGLGATKNVGDKAIEAILSARAQGSRFTSIHHFFESLNSRLVDKRVLESLVKAGAFDSLGVRRAPLMEIVEPSLRIAALRHEDRKVGQLSFFDSEGAASNEYPPLPSMEEWPQEVLLAHEKEALGCYVTANPVLKHEEALKTFTTATIDQLPEMTDGAEVTVGGILSSLKVMVTKTGPNKGNKYVSFKIGDLTGSCDAVVFANDLDKNREAMVDDAIVLASGRLSFRNEEPSLRVSTVVPIERAPEVFAGSVRIQVSSGGTEEDDLLRLRDVIAAHPGQCPLFFDVKTLEGRRVLLKSTNNFSITPSDKFIGGVEEILGTGHVRFVPRPMR